jgi:lipopolysaccharide export system ATP-binding protein
LVTVHGNGEVLRGVDSSVKNAEIVGLLGPNGAGKTICFYIIVGLIAATKGNVFSATTILPRFRCTKEPVSVSDICRKKPPFFENLP